MTQEYMVLIGHDDDGVFTPILRYIDQDKTETAVMDRATRLRAAAVQADNDDENCHGYEEDDLEARVVPLNEWLHDFRCKGQELRVELTQNEPHAWIKKGVRVKWNDPDGGTCSAVGEVSECPAMVLPDSMIVLEMDDGGTTECYPAELEPEPK
jgi:hypothetical protein